MDESQKIMVTERNQTYKTILRNKKSLLPVGEVGRVGGRGRGRETEQSHKRTFWGDGNILYLDCSNGYKDSS